MFATMKLSPAILVLGTMIGTTPTDESTTKNEKKTVTFIAAQSSADGSSEVRREVTEDCILSLPDPANIEPQTSAEAVYLREVNDEAGKNEWAKSYTAKLDVNYLSREKEMIIITTRSVQSQTPIIKNIEKKLRHSESFVSDPSEGGTSAGRSKRQYYFTKREDAIKDVRDRARVWIQAQKAVLCEDKK